MGNSPFFKKKLNWVLDNDDYEEGLLNKINILLNDNIDYNGNNEDIIMRANSPFYPFPSQNYINNKNYKTYARDNNYIKGQPIYNYPYGKIEGINEGEYYDMLEPFATPGQMANNSAFLGVIVIIFSLSVILIYYKSK